MKTQPRDTIDNLIAFHYSQYTTAETLPPPPVLDTLESGDYVLTRTDPTSTVTFMAVIDKDTGEFIDTGKRTDHNAS